MWSTLDVNDDENPEQLLDEFEEWLQTLCFYDMVECFKISLDKPFVIVIYLNKKADRSEFEDLADVVMRFSNSDKVNVGLASLSPAPVIKSFYKNK